jgi:hypothetical protein
MMLLASGEELADENPSFEFELTQPTECACGFAKPNRTRLHPIVSVPCVDTQTSSTIQVGVLLRICKKRKPEIKLVN